MMEEDDEESNILGATRYPCMPSLVALQQMRNRLHLAYLGKKLMKWTALATGRELRKIAEDMTGVYGDFSEDIRTGYILLARCRYFYPSLNKMVVENGPMKAGVVVTTTTKSISGVKCINFEIIETGVDGYQHLGIDKGGETVKRAKEVWLDLLKRMIHILQLRQSFEQVETAHRSATKRQNVITKTVIPRTKLTIHYILLELEELAREELYRIKMVVVKKKEKREKVNRKKDVKKIPSTCRFKPQKEIEVLPTVLVIEPQLKAIEHKPEVVEPKSELIPEILQELVLPHSSEQPSVDKEFSVPQDYGIEGRVRHLIRKLQNIIGLSKGFIDEHLNIDLRSFSRSCESVKLKIEGMLTKSKLTIDSCTRIDDNLQRRLEHLKCHIHEIVDVTSEFRNKSILSPSLEDFIKTCENVDDKLDSYIKSGQYATAEDTNVGLQDLQQYITDIEKLTEDYRAQGLEAPGVEAFLRQCKHTKSKIEAMKKPSTTGEDKNKLDHLKEHVNDLEQVTLDTQTEGMASKSLDQFLAACRDFKRRIEQYMAADQNKLPSDTTLDKLLLQLDEAIELSKEAKKSGLVSDSVEDFIKSCEETKKRLIEKQKMDSNRSIAPTVNLKELRNNIEDLTDMIQSLKTGLVSESFIKTCESTKNRLELYERFPLHEDSDGRMIYDSIGVEACKCKAPGTSDDDKVCTRCLELDDDEINSYDLPLPPCETCGGNSVKAQSICASRGSQQSKDTANASRESSKERKVKLDDSKSRKVAPDDSLGYFEKNVRTTVKIKRSQNVDGTIREEKETVTIRREKHDPNAIKMTEDGENTRSASYESYFTESRVVEYFTGPEVNSLGFSLFPRKAKSDSVFQVAPLSSPLLRQCISAVGNAFKDGSECLASCASSELKILIPIETPSLHFSLVFELPIPLSQSSES